MSLKESLTEAVHKRQEERDAIIKQIADRLEKVEPREREEWKNIQNLSFRQLVDSLQDGQYMAVQVLHAFQQRALQAHEKTNCVTGFVTEAEQWATELEIKFSGRDKPPLFGIPFSVKEHLELAGYDATMGFAHRINDPIADQDMVAVEILKSCGAIPFVRANLPQSMMGIFCSNPVYGRTTHPLQQRLTPGGSSGGEGALVSMGGAPFGLGTDIGGSIRIPAAFCGICGLKPTTTRISQMGMAVPFKGNVAIEGTYGPMAPEVDGVAAVFKQLLSPINSVRDPYVTWNPFRDHLYESNKPMTIGYYDFDGWFEAVPAMKRAVNIAKEALENKGHTLVPWSPPNIEQVVSSFMGAVMLDGGSCLLELANKDIPDEFMSEMYTLLRVPFWLKRLAAFLINPFYHRIAMSAAQFKSTSSELRQVHADIMDYKRAFVQEWQMAGLDCILAPSAAFPAATHELASKCITAIYYTALYNLLNFPAGVVPVTKVIEQDEQECKDSYPTYDMYAKMVKEEFSNGTVGLPVAVQCVALPNHEEICLRLMKEIESLVKPQ